MKYGICFSRRGIEIASWAIVIILSGRKTRTWKAKKPRTKKKWGMINLKTKQTRAMGNKEGTKDGGGEGEGEDDENDDDDDDDDECEQRGFAEEVALAQEFDVKLEQEFSRGMAALVSLSESLAGWKARTVQSRMEFWDELFSLPISHPARKVFYSSLFSACSAS